MHWTGHPSRLNRTTLTESYRFGDPTYAREELRAELASLFIAAETGIPHDPTNHAAYVGSWIDALRKDKNEIFRAAHDASAAADFVLSIRQIVDAYGQNESIVSNCHVRIAYAPNQVETAELLSKMTGTTTVQKASFNFSGSRFSPVMSHINESVDHVKRPLMTPDEVMRLRSPQKSGNGSSERIVAPCDMLIFISGHFPILGMQMLYFFDPELRRRAEIPPPARSRTT
ncbi:MAG TPA: zincin-like metallopeptidase domain-containing protein [Bryobacteraceae bacterium]